MRVISEERDRLSSMIESFEQGLDSSKRSNAQIAQRADSVERQYRQLLNEKEQLLAQINILESAKNALTDELEGLRSAQMKAASNHSSGQVSLQQLEKAKITIQQLQTQLGDCQAQLHVAQLRSEGLQNDLQLNNEEEEGKEVIQRQLDQSKVQEVLLATELGSVRGLLEGTEKELVQLKARHQQTQQQLSGSQSSNEAIQQQLQQTRAQLESATKLYQKQTEEALNIDAHSQQLQERVRFADRELESAKRQQQETQKQLEKASRHIGELEQQLRELNEQSRVASTQLLAQLEKQTKTTGQLEELLKQREREMNEVQVRLKGETAAQASKELVDLQENYHKVVAGSKKEVESLKQQLNEAIRKHEGDMEGLMCSTKEEVTSLRKECETLKGSLGDLQRLVAHKESELIQLTSELTLERQKARLQMIADESSADKEHVARLQSEHQQLEVSNSDLRRTVSALEFTVSEMERAEKKLSAEKLKTSEELKSSRTAVDTLKLELIQANEAARLEVSNISQQLHLEQGTVQRLQAERVQLEKDNKQFQQRQEERVVGEVQRFQGIIESEQLASQSIISDLRLQLGVCEEQLNNLHQDHRMLQDEFASAQTKLFAFDGEINELNQANEALEGELQMVLNENEHLKKAISGLETQVEQLLLEAKENEQNVVEAEDIEWPSTTVVPRKVETEKESAQQLTASKHFSQTSNSARGEEALQSARGKSLSASLKSSGGLSLNLAGIAPTQDADRMQIRRDLGSRTAAPTTSISGAAVAVTECLSISSYEEDEHEKILAIANQQMEKIQQLSLKVVQHEEVIAQQDEEINGLKQQIDLMFDDINGQRLYITDLEKFLEDQRNAAVGVVAGAAPVVAFAAKSGGSNNTGDQNVEGNLSVQELKRQVHELIAVNDELELRLEEKDGRILALEEGQNGGESAEEEIGKLNEQLEKQRQKVRRHEEDIAYQAQVIQTQSRQIEELTSGQSKAVMAVNEQEGQEEPVNSDGNSSQEIEGGLVDHLSQNAEKPNSFVGGTNNNRSQSVSTKIGGGGNGGFGVTPGLGMAISQKDFASFEDQGKSLSDYAVNSYEDDQDEDLVFGGRLNPIRGGARSGKSGSNNNRRPVSLNTQEAEAEEQQLILQKIEIQQQIAELRSEGEMVQTEDQLRIHELTRQLEANKARFEQLYKAKNSRAQKLQDMNQKYLELNQKYKELKEEKERVAQQSNAFEKELRWQEKEKSSGLNETLREASKQLEKVKEKYNAGVRVLEAALGKQRGSRGGENDNEIVILINEVLMKSKETEERQQMMLQQQQLLGAHSQNTSQHKSPRLSPSQMRSNTSTQNFVGASIIVDGSDRYSKCLELLLEEVLWSKLSGSGKLRETLENVGAKLDLQTKAKIEFYVDSLLELQKKLAGETARLQRIIDEKSQEIAGLIAVRTTPGSRKNDHYQLFSQQKSLHSSAAAGAGGVIEPFQCQDDDIIIINPGNMLNNEQMMNDSNEMSFLKEITNVIDGGKSIGGAGVFDERGAEMAKELNELRLKIDYFERQQDVLHDEIKAKDETLLTAENTIKSLKMELKKVRENSELTSQKEHVKTILLQYFAALSDKKRTLDADNYLNILFSMIGVTEADKDDVYTKLAPKSTSSDRKKSITTLLFKR